MYSLRKPILYPLKCLCCQYAYMLGTSRYYRLGIASVVLDVLYEAADLAAEQFSLQIMPVSSILHPILSHKYYREKYLWPIINGSRLISRRAGASRRA